MYNLITSTSSSSYLTLAYIKYVNACVSREEWVIIKCKRVGIRRRLIRMSFEDSFDVTVVDIFEALLLLSKSFSNMVFCEVHVFFGVAWLLDFYRYVNNVLCNNKIMNKANKNKPSSMIFWVYTLPIDVKNWIKYLSVFIFSSISLMICFTLDLHPFKEGFYSKKKKKMCYFAIKKKKVKFDSETLILIIIKLVVIHIFFI